MRWSEQQTASSIYERFARQVSERGEQPAIAGVAAPMTYAELDALADRYARELTAATRRASGGLRVAMLLAHDGRLIAAMLAALRRGASVVTLNASDPPAYLAHIRTAVEPHLLVVDDAQLELAAAAGFNESQMVRTPRGEGLAADAPPFPQPDDIAFLICTSGSTGRPKVVMQSHRNVLHNVLRYTNGLGIEPEDRIALLVSLSGGQGLATAWTALLNGATLCPFPVAQRGVTGLAEWLIDQRVTVFDTIPSVLRNFARTLRERRIEGVRLVRLASEAASRSDFELYRRHFPDDCALASVLACSEAGIVAQTVLRARDDPPEGALPVGEPAEGLEVLLLDETESRPVADGEIGEIAVQGAGLSPGYWGDEALTAQRFEVLDGARRFRSGDYATRLAPHGLVVVGRADTQVKIRGHRLQLEQVESALSGHPEVAAAAVTIRVTARGDARLTAYLTPAPGCAPTPGELRRWLRPILPPHAIPATFLAVDSIPLNAHGKADRQRLAELGSTPAPAADAAPGAGATPAADATPAPLSETAELLAGIWADAFELERVDPEANFLDLGGDSLVAAEIAAAVHDVFGVEVDLGAFDAELTIEQLAALVEQGGRSASEDELPPLRRAERVGPLSYAQTRYWEQQTGPSDTRFNVAVPLRITGPLDVDALRESLERLVRRHEILRTTYTGRDGTPLAIVHRPEPLHLPFDDLRAEPDPAARMQAILQSENDRPYDLSAGPLLRWRLLRLGESEHRLLRFSHHILHDAASWRIFFGELGVIYEALIDGRPAPLAGEPALQYLDHAVWERRAMDPRSGRFQTEAQWWQRVFEDPAPAQQLPFAPLEPDGPVTGTGLIRWGISPEDATALDRLGRAAGATYYMSRLAAFAAALIVETGAHDLLIGTPVSTRTRAELQGMFGPFVNYRIIRLRPGGESSYRDLLGLVRRSVVELSAHATIPWELLMRELHRRRVMITRVAARFTAWSSPSVMRFGGLELESLPRHCGDTWGFALGFDRGSEQDRCWVEFDPHVHDAAAIAAFLERMRSLVAVIGAEPDQPLRELHEVAA